MPRDAREQTGIDNFLHLFIIFLLPSRTAYLLHISFHFVIFCVHVRCFFHCIPEIKIHWPRFSSVNDLYALSLMANL